jgi:hypothetical protein
MALLKLSNVGCAGAMAAALFQREKALLYCRAMPGDALTIQLPVGRNGTNKRDDVLVVQELINQAMLREPAFKAAVPVFLEVDGRFGGKTEAAIVAFQRSVLKWSGAAVDGTVNPGRQTWKALNGNVPALNQIKRINGFVAFRQGKYSGVTLGSGTLTISGYGCAMCTLTMAATSIGTRTKHWPKGVSPSELTPLVVNEILKKGGAFTDSSLSMPTAAAALGMEYEEFGRTSPLGDDDLGTIEEHLSAGLPVAAHVDYKDNEHGDVTLGDHWILLVARFGNGIYQAIDPATGDALRLSGNEAITINNARYSETKTKRRGVLFGFEGCGTHPQQARYVVVRYGLLTASGQSYCS